MEDRRGRRPAPDRNGPMDLLSGDAFGGPSEGAGRGGGGPLHERAGAVASSPGLVRAGANGPIYTDTGLQLTHRRTADQVTPSGPARRLAAGAAAGPRALPQPAAAPKLSRQQRRMVRRARLLAGGLCATALLAAGTAIRAARRPSLGDERRRQPRRAAAAAAMEEASGAAASAEPAEVRARGAGIPDLAADAAALNQNLHNLEGELEQNLHDLKGEVQQNLHDLKGEVQHNLHDLKGEVQQGLHDLTGDVLSRWEGEGQQARPRFYPADVLATLRTDFDSWAARHGRDYGSEGETQGRFRVWLENHHDILDLNRKHGPCSLTGRDVFGDNHLKDLTREEFRTKYLTGYNGPRATAEEKGAAARGRTTDEALRERLLGPGGGRLGGAQREGREQMMRRHFHPTVHDLYQEFAPSESGSGRGTYTFHNCKWYDVSCLLRWTFSGIAIGGTREPAYDEDSFPTSIDWRNMGVVTSVHTQGNCGACWGITAVETIESAHAISSGTLLDLSESEVILCDDTCEMCDGGWPQNAYEYVMENGGLPAEADWSYDGDWLLVMTYLHQNGSYGNYDQNDLYNYMATQCPNSGQGGQSGSGDQGDGAGNDDAYTQKNYDRYAEIKGYGYATDRCLCYTDGTGCNCDEQNEGLALRNLASYGPATVCVDADSWQNYAGGILTAESGCGQAFLDMNHCVQAVGYAFNDGFDGGDDDGGENSGSGSGDETQRDGYWIIRNQWGTNWGMNGYIYVAMGDNVCGVLNDMTQAYT